MKTELKIGQIVKRIRPKSDYTYGRTGEIVDFMPMQNGLKPRVRVRWLYESDGRFVKTCNSNPGNGVCTWVSPDCIEVIDSDIEREQARHDKYLSENYEENGDPKKFFE